MAAAGKLTALAPLDTVPSSSLSEAVERAVVLAELKSLRRSLSIQILRLRARTEDFAAGHSQALVNAYIQAAIALRELLSRVSTTPSVLPEAVPSFVHLLSEAVLWAYRWTIAQVREVRRMVSDRTDAGSKSTTEERSVFHDLAQLCASSGSGVGRAQVENLKAIDEAIHGMIEMQDRIEHLERIRTGGR